MFNSLTVENFTAFRKAEFEFVPGINVLVGANATGKTHIMKLLYAMQKNQFQPYRDAAGSLRSVFGPENLGDLVRQNGPSKTAKISARWSDVDHEVVIQKIESEIPGPEAHVTEDLIQWNMVVPPVFIPVKDMLAHSVGFLSLYNQRYIDFDETHRDILLLAFTPLLRETSRGEMEPILRRLIAQMEARVEVKGERFYLVGDNIRFEIHMVAEGWRKLALLYQLIANGSITHGTTLYWDEPETNMNPSLMDEIIGVLLELARLGVQIFLATHSYIILKELDLQRRAYDSLRMFALERKSDGSAAVHPAETYLDLHPNLIADQFKRIYTMEISRALGGKNAI